MPIDLVHEQAITMAEARKKHLPKVGDRIISPATSYRWANRGVLAGDGTRVRLESVKLGRSLVTTQEAVARFLSELTIRSSADLSQDVVLNAETRAKLLAQGLITEIDKETGSTAAELVDGYLIARQNASTASLPAQPL